MLVLTRRLHEEVIIGGTIRIRITDLNSGSVKLGISAPQQVTIARGELHAKGFKRIPKRRQLAQVKQIPR